MHQLEQITEELAIFFFEMNHSASARSSANFSDMIDHAQRGRQFRVRAPAKSDFQEWRSTPAAGARALRKPSSQRTCQAIRGSKCPLTTTAPAAAIAAAFTVPRIFRACPFIPIFYPDILSRYLIPISYPDISLLFEQVERGFPLAPLRRGSCSDDRWAFALEARAALDRLADHAVERTGGPGGDVVGRAEDRNRGHAERGSDMHRARIVGEIDAARRCHIDEFGRARFRPRSFWFALKLRRRRRRTDRAPCSIRKIATDAPSSPATRLAASASDPAASVWPFRTRRRTHATTQSPKPSSRNRAMPLSRASGAPSRRIESARREFVDNPARRSSSR